MDLRVAIDQFLTTRRRARRSPATIRLYRRQLDAWLAHCQAQIPPLTLPDIDESALATYFGVLADTPTRGKLRQPATLASVYRTIRAFWRWCDRYGLLTSDQAALFSRLECPRVPRKPRDATDGATLDLLLEAAGDPGAGGKDGEESARMRALLLLLAESGARIAEVAGLTDQVVDLSKRRARIVGKGERHRTIFWGPRTASALAHYLLVRRGPRGGDVPFFRGSSIRNNGGPLSTDSIRAMVKRLADAHGIALPFGAPVHAFRHGFARRALREGADISDVSQLLGHGSLQTTMIYLEGDEEQLAAIYDRVFGSGRVSRRNTTQRRSAE